MLSAVTLALMANATSLVALVIWWAIFHIAANAILAGLSAVVPDQVPLRQRATVSAFVSLSLPLGAVMGALLVTRVATSTQMSYYIFIGLLLIVMMLFILVLRDKPHCAFISLPFWQASGSIQSNILILAGPGSRAS